MSIPQTNAQLLPATRASESLHWYMRDGTPCYTIIGTNGRERHVTLRDARKMGLVPSVTTIIKQGAAPGLINWMVEQAIYASLTLPRIDGENDEQLLSRIKADAQSRALKARERGTQIHAWIQQGFEGILVEPEGHPFYRAAYDAVTAECGVQTWQCEKSFARDGYGGKVDLSNFDYIFDVKTTDKPLSECRLWDEHIMQLAAYRAGKERCGIVFVHAVTPAARLIWAEEEELIKGKAMFMALLDYYYAKTGLER